MLQQAFEDRKEDALNMFLFTSETCQKKHVNHCSVRFPSRFYPASLSRHGGMKESNTSEEQDALNWAGYTGGAE